MTGKEILALVVGAMLVFWAVGAYNRLVRLRNEVTRAFAPLEAQLGQRHALLLRWIEALEPAFDGEPHLLDAVRAAAEQLRVATDQARLHPTVVGQIASLRMAEDTLTAARGRLQAELPSCEIEVRYRRYESSNNSRIRPNKSSNAVSSNSRAFAASSNSHAFNCWAQASERLENTS